MLGLVIILQLLSHSEGKVVHPTPTTQNGVSLTAMPAPTSPPKRRMGFMNNDALFPRDLESITCGYKTYDPAEPLECPGDQKCAFDNGSSSYWGPVCCPTQTDGLVVSACATSALITCIEYGDAENNYRPTGGTTYSRQLFCGLDFPNCGTLLMTMTSPVSLTGLYTSFFCATNSTSWTISAYQDTQLTLTTTSGSTVIVTTTTTEGPGADNAAAGVASSISSTDPSTGSSTNSSNRTTSTSRGEQASESVSAPATPSGESHTAAIAGGVVGGVAGLALAGAVGYLCHRKRKQRKEKVPETAN